MAGTTFQVTPEYLESQAVKVEGQCAQYNTVWNRIYTEKDSLQKYWSGEANQAYCTQLEGFRDDFQKLKNVLTAYIQYIKDSAKKYRDTDQKLASEAKSTLSTGL